MKEFALTINLENDLEKIEKYKAYHRDVWPEVIECLTSVGILNMKIWLLGRRMFMLMQAEDSFQPERDFARLEASNQRYSEWQRTMDEFQERVPEAKANEHWAAMDKVFDMSNNLP